MRIAPAAGRSFGARPRGRRAGGATISRRCRRKSAAIVESYRQHPPPLPGDEVDEAVAFLDWSRADNFTFLGIREYRLPSRHRGRSGRGIRSGTVARSLRASASTRPRTRGDDAGNQGVSGFAEGADHHESQREIARPPACASRLYGREAVRRTRPPERRIAHRRPVHRQCLHQHHRAKFPICATR